MATLNLGFVGIGLLGSAIVQRLLGSETPYNILFHVRSNSDHWSKLHTNTRCEELIALGAKPVSQLEGILRECDVICSCLPDDDALFELTNSLTSIEGLRSCTHISFGTNSTFAVRDVQAIHQRRGVSFFNCPVIGRSDAVLKNKGTVLRSGPEQSDERVEKILHSVFAEVLDFGDDVVSAAICKLSMNFLIASLIAALGEIAEIIDGDEHLNEKFLDLLGLSPIACPLILNYATSIFTKEKGNAFFKLKHGLKDIRLFDHAAGRVVGDRKITTALIQKFELAYSDGKGDWDWTDLRKLP